MEGRLIINVGGTRFETSLSTIESKPDTMIEMLLKHHVPGEELFVDRSPRLFEWVLYWYRTGVLVDHVTVGVPQEVWDLELDFYLVKIDEAECLGEMEPKKRKLVEQENTLLHKAAELKEKLSAEEEKNKQSRRESFQHMIAYILDSMGKDRQKNFEFVAPKDARNRFPQEYPASLRFGNVGFISAWFSEFEELCKDIGLVVTKISYEASKMGYSYACPPASCTEFRCKHESLKISVIVTK
jgi:hypothetical protein